MDKDFSRIDPIAVKPIELAGGRWGIVYANVRIRAGVVWGKDFTTLMMHPDHYALIAEAQTISHFAQPSGYREDEKNPDLAFGRPGGCGGCQALWAKVTPYASADEFHDAFAFDLSCMASTLRRCTEMSQIMPIADRRLADWSWISAVGTFHWAPQTSLKYFGRDVLRIAIMEPTAVSPLKLDKMGNTVQTVNYRVVKVLKGEFKKDVLLADYYLRVPERGNAVDEDPPALHQQVLAFWDDSEGSPMIAPLTDQNLQVVHEGITEDVPDIPPSSH
jgi:hypothetical protein